MVITELIVLGIICILFLAVVILTTNSERSSSLEDDRYDEDRIKFPYEENDEEMFDHPVTGYRGTKANMDAYIQNREKELARKYYDKTNIR